MGVHSFWEIIGPTASPVRLESLEGKKMAIDASIWIYQFLKAVRDDEGNAVKNSHITGFFRRICKLLYFGIKPVFVFDGGVPVLKRKTIQARHEIRQGKRDNAKKTARKLLALQIQKQEGKGFKSPSNHLDSNSPISIFKPNDDWDLPEIEGFLYDTDDQRINPNYDKEKRERLNMAVTIDDIIDDMDLDSINPASPEFEELPKAVQYQILSKLRLKSRLRMGYTKEQLQNVFPNGLDFSKFQIDMVRRRNFYTQKIINVTGMHDGGASKLDDVDVKNRIAGQKNKEYKLVKTENGWSLGMDIESGNDINQPILVDEDNKNLINGGTNKIDKSQGVHSDEEDDEIEWEDVDLKCQDKPKDNFDYSLKAGRLSQYEESKQIVGSQAFLDKRPYLEASLKRMSQDNIRNNVTVLSNSSRSYMDNSDNRRGLSMNKRKYIEEDENDDDEYLRQLEEIELMEAMYVSKMEHYGNLKKSKEASKLEDQDRKSQMNDSTNLVNTNMDKNLTIKNNSNISTQGSHDLDFILKKLPVINSQSLLFGPKDNIKLDDKNGNRIIDLMKTKKNNLNEKKNIPETPQWFLSDNQSINTIHNQSKFVDDIPDTAENSKKNYQLITGFLNTEEAIKENYQRNNQIRGVSSEKEESNDKNTNEIIEIEEGDEQPLVTDHSGNPVSNKDISSQKNKSVIGNVLSYSSDISSSGSYVDYEKEQKTIENSQPLVFNYDFMPDEEAKLIVDLKKEANDFETFKNEELLNNDNTALNNNEKIISNAFVEDELFEQQSRDKRDSDEVTTDMISDVQELLSRFGIPFITAPMEAEAQCAELLKLSLVDGIITDDSDVFLFGGTKIYKNIFQDKKYVEFYDYNMIEEKLGLNRDNMIELALLLGSDYTTGIKSMGPVSSMEVLAEFKNLKAFKKWYEEGQFDKAKLQNEDKFKKDLRKRLVRNEVVLDSEFPNKMVVNAYMNPEVDHDKTPFQWSVPDLDMLRKFLQNHIGWSWEKTDEVLIPLIRDINKRKQQKHSKQMTLTDFFPSDFATNANNTRTKINIGKRITSATNKLKRQKQK